MDLPGRYENSKVLITMITKSVQVVTVLRHCYEDVTAVMPVVTSVTAISIMRAYAFCILIISPIFIKEFYVFSYMAIKQS